MELLSLGDDRNSLNRVRIMISVTLFSLSSILPRFYDESCDILRMAPNQMYVLSDTVVLVAKKLKMSSLQL